MNSLTWIGIIAWGLFLTGFGLTGVGAGSGGSDVPQPQDVMFLIAGGMVTCLIGVIGLVGFIGWIPGLRTEQKSYS
jgi:cytochrome c biogenesis protein CcdA